MAKLFKTMFALIGIFLAGNAVAQMAPITPINPIPLKKVAPTATAPVHPTTGLRTAPSAIKPGSVAVTPQLDAEALVQAEIKRLQKKRDDISKALAKVGANYSKITYTPVTGNSCIDPDTTWKSRSGVSFSCVGMTTCNGRASRWSNSRTNPCEPGVTIDSCVVSDECKGGSTCDPSIKKCIYTGSGGK